MSFSRFPVSRAGQRLAQERQVQEIISIVKGRFPDPTPSVAAANKQLPYPGSPRRGPSCISSPHPLPLRGELDAAAAQW